MPNIARPYSSLDFYSQIENGKSYVIERNTDDIVDKLGKLVSFWAPVKNERGRGIKGVIGLQFLESDLVELLSSQSFEEPYPASYLAILDRKGNIFHRYFEPGTLNEDQAVIMDQKALKLWEEVAYPQFDNSRTSRMGLQINDTSPTVALFNTTLPIAQNQQEQLQTSQLGQLSQNLLPVTGTSESDATTEQVDQTIGMQIAMTWSPLTKINIFDEWQKENLALVVIGQRNDLVDRLHDNLWGILKFDLLIFLGITSGVNIFLFLILLCVAERILNIQLIRPINELAKTIERPHLMHTTSLGKRWREDEVEGKEKSGKDANKSMTLASLSTEMDELNTSRDRGSGSISRSMSVSENKEARKLRYVSYNEADVLQKVFKKFFFAGGGGRNQDQSAGNKQNQNILVSQQQVEFSPTPFQMNNNNAVSNSKNVSKLSVGDSMKDDENIQFQLSGQRERRNTHQNKKTQNMIDSDVKQHSETSSPDIRKVTHRLQEEGLQSIIEDESQDGQHQPNYDSPKHGALTHKTNDQTVFKLKSTTIYSDGQQSYVDQLTSRYDFSKIQYKEPNAHEHVSRSPQSIYKNATSNTKNSKQLSFEESLII